MAAELSEIGYSGIYHKTQHSYTQLLALTESHNSSKEMCVINGIELNLNSAMDSILDA